MAVVVLVAARAQLPAVAANAADANSRLAVIVAVARVLVATVAARSISAVAFAAVVIGGAWAFVLAVGARRSIAVQIAATIPIALAAVPDLAMTGHKRTAVAGEVPNPLDPPPGCAFHPRCPYADERCRTEVPALVESGDGATVACHAVEEDRI